MVTGLDKAILSAEPLKSWGLKGSLIIHHLSEEEQRPIGLESQLLAGSIRDKLGQRA